MAQERLSVYRGETREAAEAAYHADARAMVSMGYAPTAEEWSSLQDELILTVRWVDAPEQRSAVLQALDEAEAERAAARRARAPLEPPNVLNRGAPLHDPQKLQRKLTLGATTGMAAGFGLWWLLGNMSFGNPLLMFVTVVTLGFAGLFLAASDVSRST